MDRGSKEYNIGTWGRKRKWKIVGRAYNAKGEKSRGKHEVRVRWR